MQRDEQITSEPHGHHSFEAASLALVAKMSPAEVEEEGRLMDEIVQRVDRDWDMSAVPFSFYFQENADIRAERIASERAVLAAMLEGDPAEHRATREALSAALLNRQQHTDDERASG